MNKYYFAQIQYFRNLYKITGDIKSFTYDYEILSGRKQRFKHYDIIFKGLPDYENYVYKARLAICHKFLTRRIIKISLWEEEKINLSYKYYDDLLRISFINSNLIILQRLIPKLISIIRKKQILTHIFVDKPLNSDGRQIGFNALSLGHNYLTKWDAKDFRTRRRDYRGIKKKNKGNGFFSIKRVEGGRVFYGGRHQTLLNYVYRQRNLFIRFGEPMKEDLYGYNLLNYNTVFNIYTDRSLESCYFYSGFFTALFKSLEQQIFPIPKYNYLQHVLIRGFKYAPTWRWRRYRYEQYYDYCNALNESTPSWVLDNRYIKQYARIENFGIILQSFNMDKAITLTLPALQLKLQLIRNYQKKTLYKPVLKFEEFRFRDQFYYYRYFFNLINSRLTSMSWKIFHFEKSLTYNLFIIKLVEQYDQYRKYYRNDRSLTINYYGYNVIKSIRRKYKDYLRRFKKKHIYYPHYFFKYYTAEQKRDLNRRVFDLYFKKWIINYFYSYIRRNLQIYTSSHYYGREFFLSYYFQKQFYDLKRFESKFLIKEDEKVALWYVQNLVELENAIKKYTTSQELVFKCLQKQFFKTNLSYNKKYRFDVNFIKLLKTTNKYLILGKQLIKKRYYPIRTKIIRKRIDKRYRNFKQSNKELIKILLTTKPYRFYNQQNTFQSQRIYRYIKQRKLKRLNWGPYKLRNNFLSKNIDGHIRHKKFIQRRLGKLRYNLPFISLFRKFYFFKTKYGKRIFRYPFVKYIWSGKRLRSLRLRSLLKNQKLNFLQRNLFRKLEVLVSRFLEKTKKEQAAWRKQRRPKVKRYAASYFSNNIKDKKIKKLVDRVIIKNKLKEQLYHYINYYSHHDNDLDTRIKESKPVDLYSWRYNNVRKKEKITKFNFNQDKRNFTHSKSKII